MELRLQVIVFAAFLSYSSSIEWNSHSLLQPGPCPSNSASMTSFDIHQIRGGWVIQHLPWSFPQCCQQPTASFAEVPLHLQKKIGTGNETQPLWIRIGLDWSTCSDQSDGSQRQLSLRLVHNHVNEGTFLIELPWPFNVAGFATLNFVLTDYKKYAVAYICHSLLLEHIAIPFIMVRPQTELDFTDWQRMKWALIKQGVLSAWTLTETKGQCNEVFDSDVEHNVEDLIFGNRNLPNSSEIDILKNDTTESNQAVTSSNGNKWFFTNVPPNEESQTTETASIDPDPDAEWITTKFTDVQGINQDPEYQPPNGVLWPAILMENQPDPNHETELDFAFENPPRIPLLANMPIRITNLDIVANATV